MDSSDSMDENGTNFSSSMGKASTDSSDTAGICKPKSSKLKKKIAREESENNVSITSKPSSSLKRSREGKGKEEIKLSSKKMKESTQVDEKASRKRGYWTAEDEIAFLKGLLAFCEKGKLRNLPKNMGPFFRLVSKDLNDQYSPNQLYDKIRGLRAKYVGVRDKIKSKGFVGFNNVHEEAVYLLSKQVWGKGEEEDVGSVKMSQEGSVRVEEKQQFDVGEREEAKRDKTGDVKMSVMEQKGKEDEEEDYGDENEDDDDAEEGGEYKQIDNMGKEGSVRVEKKNQVDVGEREHLIRNLYGDLEMNVTEQEGEEDEEEDGDEDDEDDDDGEEEDEEEEEGQREHERIENVGKEVSRGSDSGRNRVARMETVKSVNAGEETESSEENVREEMYSSDENGTESNGNESSGEEMYSSEENEGEEQDASEESEESENESSGNEHSEQRDSKSALTESCVRENFAGHVLNGGSRENSRRGVGEGVSNDLHASGEGTNGSRTDITDLRNNGGNLPRYIPSGTANGTMDRFSAVHSRFVEGLLNNWIHFNRSSFGYRSPFESQFSFTWELPALSHKEEKLIDQKWKEQQRLELEVAYKHIALLHEENELRNARLRAMLGRALP